MMSWLKLSRKEEVQSLSRGISGFHRQLAAAASKNSTAKRCNTIMDRQQELQCSLYAPVKQGTQACVEQDALTA